MDLPKDLHERMMLRAQLRRIIDEKTDRIHRAIDTMQEYLDTETARIESEFGLTLAEVEESIKAEVVANGRSFQANGWECRFISGSVKWDTPGLEGYAVANPDVLKFRSPGKPRAAFYKSNTSD